MALARAVQRERRFQGELRMGLFYDSNPAVVPKASSDIVAQVLRQGQKKHGSAGEVEVRWQMKDFFDDQSAIEDEVRDAVNYLAGPVHFLLFEGTDQDRHPSRPQGIDELDQFKPSTDGPQGIIRAGTLCPEGRCGQYRRHRLAR
jgi:hypothetical protein